MTMTKLSVEFLGPWQTGMLFLSWTGSWCLSLILDPTQPLGAGVTDGWRAPAVLGLERNTKSQCQHPWLLRNGIHLFLSGRFNDPQIKRYMRAVRDELDRLWELRTYAWWTDWERVATLPQLPSSGLYHAIAMVAFCTHHYGQKTGVGYETLERVENCTRKGHSHHSSSTVRYLSARTTRRGGSTAKLVRPRSRVA